MKYRDMGWAIAASIVIIPGLQSASALAQQNGQSYEYRRSSTPVQPTHSSSTPDVARPTITHPPSPMPATAEQSQTPAFHLGTVHLYAGSSLPAYPFEASSAHYFDPNSSHPFTLAVAQDVYNDGGWRVVPAGSEIHGELRPSPGGLKFFGHTLVLNGRRLDIQASSDLIHDEKDPRQYSSGAIAGDAAIGAAAGALIGAVTGEISPLGVIGGAAAGVGVGNVTAQQTVVLRPGQAIALTLESPLRY